MEDTGRLIIPSRHHRRRHKDDAFSKAERKVLDQHHKQFDLLRRNEATAIEGLFRYYGKVLRDLRTGKLSKNNEDGKSQIANKGLRGFSHCLRWIKQCCPSNSALSAPHPDILGREALDLLRWGVTYDPIWNQHSAYSRGLIDVDVDEQAKTITFLPQRQVSPRFFCTQTEAKKAYDKRITRTRPDAQLAVLSKSFFSSVTSLGAELIFDDSTIRTSGAIDVVAAWMRETCLQEVAEETNLVGCTVRELRRVLATVYVYSLFVTKFEDVSEDQPAPEIGLQACVELRPQKDMVGWLATLSEVASRSVEAILSVLTFDPAHPHVTLAHQPFVATSDGRLAFLPGMILLLELQHMYVGAINKTAAGKALYAEAIGEIEAAGVKSIAEDIRNAIPHTMQVAEKPKIRMPNGQIIVPDLVIASEDEGSVLVVDVKYSTPPFGPADIDYDISEMEKWKKRMSTYVRSIQKHPGLLSQNFRWTNRGNVTVLGLTLTRWPLPVPFEYDKSVGCVDWPSLREHLLSAGGSSLHELMEWAYERPDVTVPGPLVWTPRTMNLGEWKYQFSVLALLPSDHLISMTQRLAYQLWEARGRPLWDDLRDWFDANETIAANPYIFAQMELEATASAGG